ncbi:proline racemase family protein [Amycolatopsis sp. GM8]|uniref:proline racemase family protein n=1 Tax=Amycolatopsis sp. GM8 TaxID=2896530 RepID=UPI001F3BA5DF|nr:proline racemase family protein [Amycolatopsis sp. GM8]
MIPGSIHTVDYHTGGEPFRIVTDVPDIAGDTVAEKRINAPIDPVIDGTRRLLCSEPRGHADMYGGFITPPDDEGAHFGVLFWHKDGFSTACGHGTIALGAWAIHTGRVSEDPSGTTDIIIDVPSGRVTAKVHSRNRRISSIDFVNVPSYVLHDRVEVDTTAGKLDVAISFGGAIYAQVATSQTGIQITGADLTRLIGLARGIKAQLTGTKYSEHPSDSRLDGIYGVIFFTDDGPDEHGNVQQTNVTVFADGEVDRSPCGSGTCARVATLAATGALNSEQMLIHRSIVDSVFTARIAGLTTSEGHAAVLPVVTGTAHKTGEHHFTVDPDDTLTPGFVLR